MVSEDILSQVSGDIQGRREEFLDLMRNHGVMPRDEIVESVRSTQAELLAVFGSAKEPRASRKPAPEEWSLRDLALHAVFTERLIAKLIHHLGRGEFPPREAFAGSGIGMMPEDDGRPYDAIMRELAEANETLLTAVRELPDDANAELKLPHPYFGALNCKEWAGFQRVHDLDHIQHARKIIHRV
jgi:hypothetical protein